MTFAGTVLVPFWNAKQRRLRAGWRLLLHFALTIAAILISASWLVALLGGGVDPSSVRFTAGAIIAQSLSILAIGGFCYFLIDQRSSAELRLSNGFLNEFCIGWLIGAALMGGIFLVACLGGLVRIDRLGAASPEAWGSLLSSQLLWFMLMLAVSSSEEFLSRGLQLKNLAEGLRPLGNAANCILAVLISSALFGFLHLGNSHATLASTVAITAAGIMLATARIVSGRLALPIGIHAAWNYFQGPVFGFAVSGINTEGSLLSVTSVGPTWLTGGEFGPEAGMLGVCGIAAGLALILLWRFAVRKTPQPSLAHDFAQLVRYRRPPRALQCDLRSFNRLEPPTTGEEPPTGKPN